MTMFLREAADSLETSPTEEAVFNAALTLLKQDGVNVPHLETTEEKRSYLLRLMRSQHPLPEKVVYLLRSMQPAW